MDILILLPVLFYLAIPGGIIVYTEYATEVWLWIKRLKEAVGNNTTRVTAGFGLTLYCIDIGSDVYAGCELVWKCDYILGTLVLSFVFLPMR